MTDRQAYRIIPAYAGNTQEPRDTRRRRPDHPRVRGEHSATSDRVRPCNGSSPRTRGTLFADDHRRDFVRIIPAYAGNTRSRSGTPRLPPDHPRVRGEHALLPSYQGVENGSSPRTRGTQRRETGCGRRDRIIPAYAGNTARLARACERAADHPRVRGEHAASVSFVSISDGSSPRTRGTPRHARTHGWRERIIPAYAGNTFIACLARAPRTDHPRVRGEHAFFAASSAWTNGSSPRTRGTPRAARRECAPRRIIPAYAGNTGTDGRLVSTPADHPRVRGEHVQPGMKPPRLFGSSPRTRGTRGQTHRRPCRCRIIPAYAGNTVLTHSLASCHADHPRVRGEHRFNRPLPSNYSGSSPRTRGTLDLGQTRIVGLRIIPAYAGNTACRVSSDARTTDHPRVRGEHWRAAWVSEIEAGSSPRTRGTPLGRAVPATDCRIIPAYAGNTSSRVQPVARIADHPRVRGEHDNTTIPVIVSSGSSPRTRGTQGMAQRNATLERIIPAYAGNTSTPRSRCRRGTDHPRVRGEHTRPPCWP